MRLPLRSHWCRPRRRFVPPCYLKWHRPLQVEHGENAIQSILQFVNMQEISRRWLADSLGSRPWWCLMQLNAWDMFSDGSLMVWWQNVVLRWEHVLGYIQCFIVSSRTDTTDHELARCQAGILGELFLLNNSKWPPPKYLCSKNLAYIRLRDLILMAKPMF